MQHGTQTRSTGDEGREAHGRVTPMARWHPPSAPPLPAPLGRARSKCLYTREPLTGLSCENYESKKQTF